MYESVRLSNSTTLTIETSHRVIQLSLRSDLNLPRRRLRTRKVYPPNMIERWFGITWEHKLLKQVENMKESIAKAEHIEQERRRLKQEAEQRANQAVQFLVHDVGEDK